MKRGRLTLTAQDERDCVEDVMFRLARARRVMDEVRLRLKQARSRSAVVEDVLAPADDRLDEIGDLLDRSVEKWKLIWKEGQRRKWK